ncbi:MAG: PLDc N-terminal domain-containing protein [Dehalococcoidia bacterium]|nr:PLDc N-terminal domain-containing protein [Dehalococcoidia bacterium]
MSFLVILAILLFVFFQLGVQVLAGIDIGRRKRVRGGNKWIWVWVILVGLLPGAIAYLVAGRLGDQPPVPFDGETGAV